MSLLTTNNRIPILAPPRGERARLEALLSDVWTRDILPFPGITARSRSEYLVKSSASSMMRKLSVAGITNNFSIRSRSQTNLHSADNSEGGAPTRLTRRQARSEPIASGDEKKQATVLSSIPDETESRVESEWGIDVLRTVERIIGDSEMQTAETEEQDRQIPPPPVPQPPTPGNKRLRRHRPTLKKIRSSSYIWEKENMFESLIADPEKSKRLWPKVGTRHREAVFQGIRGFFD